jgi:hypothetical protein
MICAEFLGYLEGPVCAAVLYHDDFNRIGLLFAKIKDLLEGLRQALLFVISWENERKKRRFQVIPLNFSGMIIVQGVKDCTYQYYDGNN